MYQDFMSYDGNLARCMREAADFVEQNPESTIVILCQDSGYIKIRVYLN